MDEGPSQGAKKRALGRGLGALIGEGSAALARAGTAPGEGRLRDLSLDVIAVSRRQPRRAFDPDELAELAASIKALGVVQPVVVRPLSETGGAGAPAAPGGARYELIAGERRLRAAREAGLETVPAVVRPADDRDTLLLGLVENVARENLTPVEEARAYAVLSDEFGLSLGEIGEQVGRSKPSVSNRLRLLELPDEVLGMLDRQLLTEGHARAVLALPGHDERKKLARRIVREGMSVRAAERAARWGGARTKERRRAAPVDPALAARAAVAAVKLTGRPARIAPGRLELPFADETELEELVEALERAAG